MRRPCLSLAVVIGCASVAACAGAATYEWTQNSGGAFNTTANWTPTGLPVAADTIRFDITNTYAVTFSTPVTVNTLLQTRGNVTFDLNGTTFRATNTTNNSMGSTAQTSTMHVTDGTFRPGNFTIGAVANSTSNLFLDAASNTTFGTGPLQVGLAGTGNLTVRDGAVLVASDGAGLGIDAGGVGTATITGTSSSWTINTAPLRIGSFGNGAVNILENGLVTAFGLEIGEKFDSVGALSLSGIGATFTTAGIANIGGASATLPAASATLNIATGATANLNGTTNLRTHARINLTGGTLNLNTVNVANGALVDWQAGTVNFATGSTVTTSLIDLLLGGTHTLGPNRTLSATAGTLTLASTLVLTGGRIAAPTIDLNANLDISGFSNIVAGTTMNIQSGRTIQLRDFSTLAAATTAINNNGGTLVLGGPFVNVTGPFVNTSGYVRGVGRFTGGLNNGAAGTIRAESGDHLIIDQTARTNAGTIELAGGTVEYSQSLSNLSGGVITGRGVFRGSSATPGGTGLNNAGVLSFSAGITDIFGDVNNNAGGKIIAAGGSVVTFYDDVVHNGAEIRTNSGSRSVFFGSVTGAGPFTGTGNVELNGDLKPGNSPANLSFGGNVVISPTAGLDIELAGITKGTGYDALTITGAASLSGSLDVALVSGFVPSAGQSFEIISALGGINGTFDHEQLPKLGGGLYFDVQYQPNSVLLAVAGNTGDYNYDGQVNAADYVVWRKMLPVLADGNQNGRIDPSDQTLWQANFGEPAFPGLSLSKSADGSVNSSAPEPTSLTLILLSLTLLHLRRPRSTPLAV